MTGKIIVFIAIELLIIYLLFGGYLIRRLAPTRHRLRLLCRDYSRHLGRIIRHDRDLLSPDTENRIRQLRTEARELSRQAELSEQELRDQIRKIEEKSEKILSGRQKKWAWLHETMEVMTVALALAFGFRALFLQPFKIPTGSMQPTLYGIHFIEQDQIPSKSLPRRAFDFIHFSNRYVDRIVQRTGFYEGARPDRGNPPLQTTTIRIAGVDYTLPGDLEAVKKQVARINIFENQRELFLRRRAAGYETQPPSPPHFQAGEILSRGWLRSGDHVFVNRFRHNFTEVDRGDIVVFLTDGLRDADGNPLRGRFFIKRLVGMPGDQLMIDDHNYLLIKPSGEQEFVRLDENFAPAFARIYSGLGGYHGYIASMPGAGYSLTKPYTVPDNHYFMLGDNSAQSQDSRYWGSVPRANLIGRATIAWWPLSRRWGFIDRTEPVPVPTPPLHPYLPVE